MSELAEEPHLIDLGTEDIAYCGVRLAEVLDERDRVRARKRHFHALVASRDAAEIPRDCWKGSQSMCHGRVERIERLFLRRMGQLQVEERRLRMELRTRRGVRKVLVEHVYDYKRKVVVTALWPAGPLTRTFLAERPMTVVERQAELPGIK